MTTKQPIYIHVSRTDQRSQSDVNSCRFIPITFKSCFTLLWASRKPSSKETGDSNERLLQVHVLLTCSSNYSDFLDVLPVMSTYLNLNLKPPRQKQPLIHISYTAWWGRWPDGLKHSCTPFLWEYESWRLTYIHKYWFGSGMPWSY